MEEDTRLGKQKVMVVFSATYVHMQRREVEACLPGGLSQQRESYVRDVCRCE